MQVFIIHKNKMCNYLPSTIAWHGGSLAIAELARRGLLLPERLSSTIDKITLALQFDSNLGIIIFIFIYFCMYLCFIKVPITLART